MEWIYTDPIRAGKYIVTTITKMGKFNKFDAYWNGKNWSFSNQVFVKYLKE